MALPSSKATALVLTATACSLHSSPHLCLQTQLFALRAIWRLPATRRWKRELNASSKTTYNQDLRQEVTMQVTKKETKERSFYKKTLDKRNNKHLSFPDISISCIPVFYSSAISSASSRSSRLASASPVVSSGTTKQTPCLPHRKPLGAFSEGWIRLGWGAESGQGAGMLIIFRNHS